MPNQSNMLIQKLAKASYKNKGITPTTYDELLVILLEAQNSSHPPLHIAVSKGNVEVVKFLVEKAKVPLNELSRFIYDGHPIVEQHTAFDLAVAMGNTGLMSYLVGKKASPSLYSMALAIHFRRNEALN